MDTWLIFETHFNKMQFNVSESEKSYSKEHFTVIYHRSAKRQKATTTNLKYMQNFFKKKERKGKRLYT